MASSRTPQPIAHQSKSGAVYAELRQRILDGALAPSAQLNQEQLAAELGVSTTPLREALRRLESERLVTMAAHRDVVVAPLDPEEMISVYEVREELDPLAAALAAERHSDEQAAEIEAATARLGDASEPDQLGVNRAYHGAIYGACGNPILIELLDVLWDRSDRYRRAVGMATDPTIVAEHREIAEAVLGRRAQDARSLMQRHIARTLAAFREKYGTEAGSAAG
jgi:DNA-binding GntR family transcriptional regulator